VLLRSLERFEVDSVLLPYNFPMMQNEDYAAGFEKVAARCAESGVAIQTIKAIARRPRRDESKAYATWYEPLQSQEDIDRAVHWVLARPNVFLNSAGDVNIAPRIFDAARRFDPNRALSEEEMQQFAMDAGLEPLFPVAEEGT